MTQDIGSGSHREPSSASIDIARLKERHNALKDDVSDMRANIMDIKNLLLSHITSARERHDALIDTFNRHNLEDAVAHTRISQIDTHLTATDTRLADIQEESKRDPVTFWTSVGAAGTAIAAVLTAIFGGKP